MDTYSHLYPNKHVEVARHSSTASCHEPLTTKMLQMQPICSYSKRKILKNAVISTLFRIQKTLNIYSHSIVAGGLLVTSSVTRFTCGTSLHMRRLTVSSSS